LREIVSESVQERGRWRGKGSEGVNECQREREREREIERGLRDPILFQNRINIFFHQKQKVLVI
jgi:hypothetical protein